MEKKCFVIQRFDGGRYDSLYKEIFKPAIEQAGFSPYRVDQDPSASIPIEAIEQHITNSDACFVEISEDNPNVWFELGYSIARQKPLCLVCSKDREKFPFDIQHRKIIRYPTRPVPSEYEKLRSEIADRLQSVAKSEIALKETAEVVEGLSTSPTMNGLRPHELLALTMIFQSEYTGGISGWSLNQDMQRGGYNSIAATLAIKGLAKANLIRIEEGTNMNDEPYTSLSVTSSGEDWLMEHQDELNLRITKLNPDTVIAKITEDDIPF